LGIYGHNYKYSASADVLNVDFSCEAPLLA
jgi:hypothetical protein